jgi:hypothetical protein
MIRANYDLKANIRVGWSTDCYLCAAFVSLVVVCVAVLLLCCLVLKVTTSQWVGLHTATAVLQPIHSTSDVTNSFVMAQLHCRTHMP